jgi:hypothetical protein
MLIARVHPGVARQTRREWRIVSGEWRIPQFAIRYLAIRMTACFIRSVLRRPGGHSEEPIPDPIPNSAVKVLCADGTKS